MAQIRGWQSEERKKRKAQLLQLNDIGLRVALGHAVRTDVFFIPKAHFAKEAPEQGDEGWWYQVRHTRSVCPGTACRTGISARKQKISKFIRAQWESHEMECMEDESRQLLEEAAELDHIWGAWETGAELTNDATEWLKQTALSRDDLRYHVVVHASHQEQRWEPPSASLIERDPEVIPDVDIAAKVGTDLILDEKIPRHESGRGYVRVVEHLVLWKEKEASKVFTKD